MKITKTDILTMVLLSVVFFGLAVWNLGETQYPLSNWESTTPQSFYVDLGSLQQVHDAFFWVKSGNASVSVYSGSPGNWSFVGNYSLTDRGTDYSVQNSFSLNVETQYLEFNVNPVTYDSQPMFANWGVTNPTDQEPSPYAQLSEIGLDNPDLQQIPIVGVTGINGTDAALSALADEQNSLEIPPTYMSKMYFDEVYFARSAENYVNHMIPHERTHPPLGKLIQAVGVALAGETPFGWRIMGVIFGTLMVPLMFLIAKKLFGTWIGGFSAAFLFTFDFMHFTMARIGTVDTYVVFFSLLTQLFFLIYFARVIKDGWKTSVIPLFLASVCAALAFSTKWFSLYGVVGMIALLLALRLKDVAKLKASLRERYVAFFDHPFLLMIAFAGVFAAIYFATYIPEMLMGNSPVTIYNLQNAMFGFHSGSVVDSSAAPWWSWPFMFRLDGVTVPKWFDITYNLPNGTLSTISAFGNPVVWWVGFGAMVFLAVEAFHVEALLSNLWSRIKKGAAQVSIRGQGWDASALFIVVVFLFSWLPYVLIGRATYIYHFYLSVPLLCLALTYFINKYWHKPEGKAAAIAIFAATVAMFVLFYPVISGAPTTSEYIHNLKWFPSWFFAP
ncbi:MAG: phospholipid carrier-dependent glycosyltransferase [Candidatus Bathyarchaeota archaeon]|nr:phospholipid carrier-dependent glycosyltransferase [Candidatus Bathyarchaeota archaeon]